MLLVNLGELELRSEAAWNGLFDVAAVMPEGWALAGGQMVYVHCQEHGVAPERPSDDGDVILDVRAHPTALKDFVTALKQVGFDADGSTWQGHQHRWVRGDATIDVLVPRHLGPFSARRDKLARISTIGAPGSQHLLNRTETIEVMLGNRKAQIRRPDLMGAIAAKAAAYREIADDPAKDRHLIDILVLAGFLSARALRGREPWKRLEQRRIRSAVGAIRATGSVSRRFEDVDDRLSALAQALDFYQP